MADEFCLKNARLPRKIKGSFTCGKSTTWDRRLYFPSEERRAEYFFALKNPTASIGFEPVHLGTKGQHGTSRPPKPLLMARYGTTFMNLYRVSNRKSGAVSQISPKIVASTCSMLYMQPLSCDPVAFLKYYSK